MATPSKKILITGLPGAGKTTLIREISRRLYRMNPSGFYTAEIREQGRRKGFRLIDFNGHDLILAHVDFRGDFRVGPYGVNVEAFNRYLEKAALEAAPSSVIILDEIGKMECLSSRFAALIRAIMDSDRGIIATVARRGEGLIEEIKNRRDIMLFEITSGNRDRLASEIIDFYSE